jgi:hypothetical protein
LIQNADILNERYKPELKALLSRQTYKNIDPELLKWEVWTNDLIKWSEQNYKYEIPRQPEDDNSKIQQKYKKYLALFSKEMKDRAISKQNSSQIDQSQVPIELSVRNYQIKRQDSTISNNFSNIENKSKSVS